MKRKMASLVFASMFAMGSIASAHGGGQSAEVELLSHEPFKASTAIHLENDHGTIMVSVDNTARDQDLQYKLIRTDYRGRSQVITGGYIFPSSFKTFHRRVHDGDYTLLLSCPAGKGCEGIGSLEEE